jgi:thiamine monophosphate synthase
VAGQAGDGYSDRDEEFDRRERADSERDGEIENRVIECGAGALAREISPRKPLIAISCHSPQEVAKAIANQATLAVFAPVFEKTNTQPTGLEALRQACQAKIPVLALGGVTLQNAQSCLQAGAAGIAAIRLFQENEIDKIVRQLRS